MENTEELSQKALDIINKEKNIVRIQGEQIKELRETIYKIQLTGEIPPLSYKVRTRKSFKRFVAENVDMQQYANKKALRKIKDLENKAKKLEQIVKANNLDYKSVSLHKTSRNYIRIAMFLNVQELLDKITSCKEEFYTLPNGYKVRTQSLRYHTFVHNLDCVECGLKGCFLALEKSLYDDGGNEGHKEGRGYHLNLYALNELGQEVLMTKDHIQPKSKGGADSLENLQTMCVKCNERKGNAYE